MLPVSALDYRLPGELIATRPADPRDSSRLMVVSRGNPSSVDHVRFRDLPTFLRDGDRLVFNTSEVVPARLRGRRVATGGSIEGLFLRTIEPGLWSLMLRSGGRLVAGDLVRLSTPTGDASPFALRLERKEGDDWSARLIGESGERLPPDDAVLRAVGATPLPPYILKARVHASQSVSDGLDRAWYQTVYAQASAVGSVAAPTAGLHFTTGLLAELRGRGAERSNVVLSVGPGTFKPVREQSFEDHQMHAEDFAVPAVAIAELEATRRSGGRIVPVGTTAVRVLESLPRPIPEAVRSGGFAGSTSLLITPGFPFTWTDALITNFHLPRSTLLALVAAFLDTAGTNGVDRVIDLYRQAVAERYRFYSYGDAMLILP